MPFPDIEPMLRDDTYGQVRLPLGASMLLSISRDDSGRLIEAGRRWTPPPRLLSVRLRSWLLRGAIALPGLAVECYGIGSPPTAIAKLWHDIGLPFLLLAATWPLWHRAERSLLEPMRWREMVRRALWRTSAVLLFGAEFSLIAMWSFAVAGNHTSAAQASKIGLLLLLLALVPPPLEPVLRRLCPSGQRRAERVARLVEELCACAPSDGSDFDPPLRGALPNWWKTDPELAAEFDPGRGAGGRIEPIYEYGGGAPGRGLARYEITSGLGSAVRVRVAWDGDAITVTDARHGRTHRVPLASRVRAQALSQVQGSGGSGVSGMGIESRPRRRCPAVAELVWIEARYRHATRRTPVRWRSLLFLDEEGYCFLGVDPFGCDWFQTVQLAMAAGLPCAAYEVRVLAANAGRIRELMFPRRRRSMVVRGA